MISALVTAGIGLVGSVANIAGSVSAIKNQKKLYKSQKKLLGEQKKTAEQRYRFNEEEIMNAFKENYKRTSYAYGQKIADVMSQKSEVASNITAQATAKLSNVDIQGSSFHNSQIMELDQEFQEATSTLVYNQAQTLSDLAAEKESALHKNNLGMIDYNTKSEMEEFQIKNDRDMAIQYQQSKIVSEMANLYKSASKTKKEYGNLQSAIETKKNSTNGFKWTDLFKSQGGN